MLRGFLRHLPQHLTGHGEAWLVLSDLAVRLGLRAGTEALIADAGLRVLDRLDVRPRHKVSRDDPLAEYRAAEITSLWRIGGRIRV
jgi:prophage antirepressor-like protein